MPLLYLINFPHSYFPYASFNSPTLVLLKNIVTTIICSQYGSIITCTVLLSKSQTSALQNKLWKWEKDIKKQCNSGSALSLTVAYSPAPSVYKNCGPARSVPKGVGADPCESQKGASLFLETHFELILDASRRNLDVVGSLLGGSCIP